MNKNELYLIRNTGEKNNDSNDSKDRGSKIEVPGSEDVENRIHSSIIGQKEAAKNFADLKKILESGIRRGRGPVHVEWLSGPSGVGKTEMVKKLIDIMLEDNPQYDEDGKLIENAKASDNMVRIDGGSYQSEHEIAKVLGAPPGYVGSGGPGNSYIEPILSQENIERNSIYYTDEQGNERKVCFILIDEAEKANQALYRALLSSLDDGVLTLGNNKKVDLSNCVFLFTSNLGNKEVLEAKKSGDPRTPEEIYTEKYKEHFPPEFLGRVRKMTVFEHLSREEVKQIVSLRLEEIKKVFILNDINLGLDITDEAIDWLVDRGYSKSEGARAMQKLMNDCVQDPLTLISNKYVLDGKNIIIDVDSGGQKLEFFSPDGDLKEKPRKEKKPGRRPKPKPEETNPSAGRTSGTESKKPDNGEDPDLIYRVEFYKDLVNSRVRETLNPDSIILIDNLCDTVVEWYQKRRNASLDVAKDQVTKILSQTRDSYRNSDINNAEDLANYFKDYLKKELNVDVEIVDHCDKCNKH